MPLRLPISSVRSRVFKAATTGCFAATDMLGVRP